MAWTTLPTYTNGNVLTDAQLNAIAANINETAAAKVTASGQLVVSTGPNTLAARSVGANRVTGGSQQTTNGTLGDNLTTVGPTVTVSTGSAVLVTLTSYIMSTTAQGGGWMGYAISGATTIAASTDRSLRLMSDVASVRSRASAVNWQTGLNVGSNTFKAQYATVTAPQVADFDEREIAVLPLS